jgi:hypothetical protein
MSSCARRNPQKKNRLFNNILAMIIISCSIASDHLHEALQASSSSLLVAAVLFVFVVDRVHHCRRLLLLLSRGQPQGFHQHRKSLLCLAPPVASSPSHRGRHPPPRIINHRPSCHSRVSRALGHRSIHRHDYFSSTSISAAAAPKSSLRHLPSRTAGSISAVIQTPQWADASSTAE